MVHVISTIIQGIFLFAAIWGTMAWINRLLQKEYNEHGIVFMVALYWSLYITLLTI